MKYSYVPVARDAKNLIVPIMMFIGILALRPTILGGTYSIFGVVMLCGALFISSILKYDGFDFAGNVARKMDWSITFVTIILWMYIVSSTVLMSNSDILDVVKGATLAVSCALIAPFVFRIEATKVLFFRWFAGVNSLFGWSIFITYLLLILIPYDNLFLFNIPVFNYEYIEGGGDVLFPITIVYGYLTEYEVYRFCGIARESGIAQAFFCWSIFYSIYERKSIFWITGAVLGAVFCGSSIAYPMIGISIFINYSARRDNTIWINLILIAIFAAIVILTLYSSGTGLLDKQDTHSASGEDRTLAMQYAIFQNDNILFGNGLGNIYAPVLGLGINAISQIYYIGIVGFLLFVMQFLIVPVLYCIERRRYLAIISPLLLTSVFFQPLLDAPLIILLLYYIPPNNCKNYTVGDVI